MHQHHYILSDKKGYEICECGTYHSIELLPPDELYLNDYWNGKTRSTIKEQVHNLTETNSTGISKIDKVLSYMGDKCGVVLEIGCAPGIFMNIANKKGYRVMGIEPDKNNISEIIKIAGQSATIIQGYFPKVLENNELFLFDFIVAMDVVEHIEDYKSFIKAAYDKLKPFGKFIFMSPIIYTDNLYRGIDFIPHEHAHIFSQKYLQDYLFSIFNEVLFDRWIVGHELVICTK
jgi:2-polyprenyl-3-methyl-5-hydroxy-6-metoxy-1,4-benzoquinol methylase